VVIGNYVDAARNFERANSRSAVIEQLLLGSLHPLTKNDRCPNILTILYFTSGSPNEAASRTFGFDNRTASISPRKFLAYAQNGTAFPDPAWLDTVNIPVGGTVDVILDFRDPVIKGMSVFHCHLVESRRQGEDGKDFVQVVETSAGRRWNRWLAALRLAL
jgi:hypothetical protein